MKTLTVMIQISALAIATVLGFSLFTVGTSALSLAV
jgi:hypothetical protein